MCVSGEPVYEACLTKVEKVLYRKVTKAAEAADMDFYAFSYYYDRAVDLGVIGRKLHFQDSSQSSAVVINKHFLQNLTST